MATSLLSENVLDAKGQSVPSSSLAGGVLGLYFSAHWCPPCRGFTPVLSEWYTNFVKNNPDKKLSIVFVSSDRSEKDFKEYHESMGFHALPFEERDRKTALSKKFKVSGIPTLVFLDEHGELLSKDGRRIVPSDKDGKDYPWKPKSFVDIISAGAPFASNKGDGVSWADLAGKYVSIYFSAHWCGPCRGFTPELVKAYEAAKAAGKPWEIIFASSDRDEESFDEYFKTMPWLALPFEDPRIDALSEHFGVEGIPTLVLVDPAGKVLTTSLREAIDSDPTAARFPWPKQAVGTMRSIIGDINETPTLLALIDTDGQAAAATALFQAVGERELAQAETRLQVGVSEATDADRAVRGRILQLCKRDGQPLPLPAYVLLDISEGRWFPVPDGATSDQIVTFVDDFFASKLTPRKLGDD